MSLTRIASIAHILVALLIALNLALPDTLLGAQTAAINFTRKTILTAATPGASAFGNPTTLTFGPDGRLYVGQQNGLIFALTLNNDRDVTDVDQFKTIYNTPNKNSDGSDAPSVVGRTQLGIVFDPDSTAEAPIMYVTHSDPRTGTNNSDQALAIDTYSGMLTRLTGPDFDAPNNRRNMIWDLPRSRANHATNGLAWGPDGWLYFNQGGNTNNGAPSTYFSDMPERYLTAATLRANVKSPDFQPFSARQIDSPAQERPGIFELYATGYRNAYDLVWHSNGKLYTIDNGGNSGLGTTPGPSAGCPAAQALDLATQMDHVHRVTQGAYGGHPNPTRGECVLDDGTGYSPDLAALPNYTPPLVRFDVNGKSTNGMAEYRAATFNGEMLGNLLAATWGGDQNLRRIVLSNDGNTVVSVTTLGAFNKPLDVAIDAGGAIFVAEHGAGAVSVLVPSSGVCPLPGDPTLIDSDGDGYTDQDEIDNLTDPCNQASSPPDFDLDLVSDLNDPDDDNDTIPDAQDQLFFDASNGTDTTLPLSLGWNPGDPPRGGVLNSGFTGVQISSNGLRYAPERISVGAAGGFLTIDATTGSNAGTTNTQVNALQLGFDARQPFRVSTRLTDPFLGKTPSGNQAGGIFLGLDQDNYVKLIVTANNGTGVPGIQFAIESGGTLTRNPTGANPSIRLPGPANIDLFLDGDPINGAISAYYRIDSSNPGAIVLIGTLNASKYPVIGRFFTNGLPAGLLTTRTGSTEPITFGFDFFAIDPLGLPTDDRDPAIRYDGWRGVRDDAAAGGTYRWADVSGQKITYQTAISTTAITLITYRGPDQGKARVTIDGVNKGILDLYAATPNPQYLQTYSDLAFARHTIVITVLGKKSVRSSGTQIRVDGFRVEGSTIDDSNPSVKYTNWSGKAETRALGGSYRSASTNASASFSFTGTRVTWITARGPAYGQAEVYIDEELIRTVDLYSATQQWHSFQVIDGLSVGNHTIRIAVLGIHNTSSTGSTVIIDGFDLP